LGVNGLFSNILTLLSLAELGVGIAIVYSLYKPIADNDEITIKGLMEYYKVVYRAIGLFITLVGFSLLPFLNYVIKDANYVGNIEIIYCIFVLNTSVTYFLSYKRSMLIADQKKYVETKIHYFVFFLSNLIQILSLLIFGNFILFLIISLISKVIENFVIIRYVDKRYPYLKKTKGAKLNSNERKSLSVNIRALAFHKFGSIIVNSTDNIVISKYLGLAWVGLYSNYYIITSALVTVLSQIFGSVTASVGNLIVTSSNEKTVDMYFNIMMVNFWLYGLTCILFYILANDFITLWIGEQFLFNKAIVFVLSVNLFLNGTRKTTLLFKDAKGLFWADRYKPIFEGILNLIISILLVQKIGFIGVFVGTIISNIFSTFWIEPVVLFKHGFNIKVSTYFLKYFKHLLISIIAFLLASSLTSFIAFSPLLNLVLKLLVSFLTVNVVYYLFLSKTKEFHYFKKIIDNLIK
ncbi:MAG: hypothetical protein VB048_07490, partial [Bacteroidaceae bacterium]|nr:hypothetical protein [Bacteroidaceae bacterium]